MVTVEHLEHLANCMHVDVYTTDKLTDCLGYYDDDNKIIVMQDQLSRVDYKCTLAHELVHASFHDSQCFTVKACHVQEQRCKRMTARLLISLTDYIVAEAMYDTHVQLIARELDVTPTVVRDFQGLLRNRQLLQQEFDEKLFVLGTQRLSL